MADIREPWREVANRAEALGLKLRLHLEQEERAEPATGGVPTADTPFDGPEPPPPGAGTGSAGTATGTTRAAIDELGNKLKDAFESFGAAARDPAVRSDVSDIGVLLKDALVATFTAVGADVTEAVKDVTEAVKAKRSTGDDGTPAPPAGQPPADAPVDDITVADGPVDDTPPTGTTADPDPTS